MAEFDALRPTLQDGPTLLQQTQQERQLAAEPEEPNRDAPSLGEQWDLATERVWLSSDIERGRRVDEARRDAGGRDPNYVLTQDKIQGWAQKYTQDEQEYLAESLNAQEEQARIKNIEDMRANYERMEQAGVSSFWMELAAGVVDPIALPALVLTGGVGGIAGRTALGARAASTVGGRVAIAGGAGAVENAAIQAAAQKNNPLAGIEDILLAAATGGVISGAVPALGATVRGAASKRRAAAQAAEERAADMPGRAADSRVLQAMEDADAESLSAANAVERQVRTEAEQIRESIVAGDIARVLPPETFRDQADLDFLADSLRPTAAQRASKGTRDKLRTRRRAAQAEVDYLEVQRQDVLAEQVGGSGKALRRARKAVQDRAADIRARADQLNREIGDLDGALAQQEAAEEAFADMTRLSQGIVPERLQSELDGLRAGRESFKQSLRNMILNRADENRPRIDPAPAARQTDQGDVTAAQAAEADRAAQESTAGAQRVPGTEDFIYTYSDPLGGRMESRMEQLSQLEENIPRSWNTYLFGPSRRLREQLQGSYTTLNMSRNPFTRALNAQMNVDSQGQGVDGLIPMAAYQDMFKRRLMRHWKPERAARLEYAKARGINAIKAELQMSPEMAEFDNAVFKAVVSGQEPTGPGAEAIKKAAEARRAVYRESLALRKDNNVLGFEGVEARQEYYSMLLDLHKMQKAIRDNPRGAPLVEDLLTKAYREGAVGMSEESARTVARAQIIRTMRRGDPARREMEDTIGTTERRNLRRELTSLAGGAEDPNVADMIRNALQDFFEVFDDKVELSDGVSKRAKFSLGADLNASIDGLSMADIVDTSWDAVAQYGREAAGDASIAKHGYRSRGDLENTIETQYQEGRDLLETELRGLREQGLTSEADKLQAYLDGPMKREKIILADTVKMIYSQTLDKITEDNRALYSTSRTLRNYTSAMRLGWNSFPSVAENANALQQYGWQTWVRNAKAAQKIRVGEPNADETLEELYGIMGAYGHEENFLSSTYYREETLGEANVSRIGRAIENGVGVAQDKTQLLSGFRTVQNGSEEIVLRSMSERLSKVANGDLRAKPKDKKLFTDAGLSEEEYEAVLEHIRSSPEFITDIDGNQRRTLTAATMDPVLRDKLGAAMSLALGRQMQRNFIGETSIFMNKELGRTMLQFRTFPIVSMEKQLIAGLRGDKIALGIKLGWGSLLAYMSYNARVHMKAKLEDDPEEYIAKATTPAAMANGVLNMNATLGGFGMTMDGLATMNLLPEEWMASSGRWGYRSYGLDSVPVVGMGQDLAATATGGVGLAKSVLMGEGLEDAESERFMKNLYKTVPLIGTTAVGAGMSVVQ